MRTNATTLLLIIIIVQLYRLFVLLNAHIDLYVDEAYYWGWSKALAFGYYSKPPMIAWTIALFTSICGDSFLCIKLPALIIYPITTIFIYLIAKELFDKKIAFWSGVAFITLPAVSMSSLIISTDVVLLLFWSMSIYFFIKALQSDKTIYWIAAAIAAGCGLLSKYTMILFLVSVFLYLYWEPKYRHHLKNAKLYLTIFIAALIYMPNFLWNASHHFISFVHTEHISHIHQSSHFHPLKFLEFLASQFLVFGPIFFALFLYLLFRPIKKERFRILYAFALPIFAIISLQALISHALANWAAPTYVTATILVVGYLLVKEYKKVLYLAVAINLCLALLFYHYHQLLHLLHIPLTSKIDPYKRVRGYSWLAQKLAPLLKAHPKELLLFDRRSIMAEMIYYLHPHPFDAVIFNPNHHISSQYHLTTDLNRHRGQDFLYITDNPNPSISKYFHHVKLLATIPLRLYPDKTKIYYLYEAKGFKGY